MPDRRIFKREPFVSEFEARANAKRFEKWEAPRAQDNNQQKRKQVKIAPSYKSGVKSNLDQFRGMASHENLLKVKLDMVDPNDLDMELLYRDNLPPGAQALADFINDFKDKDSKDDVSVLAVKEKAFSNYRQMVNLLPEEGRDWKKISALQF